MKILEIINNQGYFTLDGERNKITNIGKEDIFNLLNIIFENNNVEMDEINDENMILNDAQRIIYTTIYKYFQSFINQKENLKKEIEEEFSDITKMLQDDENNEDGESLKH